MKNFLTVNHSSYGSMLRTAMSLLVTKNQKLSSTDIRGQIDPRPRVSMENPNALALLFQDKYKQITKIQGRDSIIILVVRMTITSESDSSEKK